MAEPLVKVHVHEHAGTLILNRPAKRNALSRQMLTELEQGLRDLHGQRKVRGVIVTGAGTAFCAGLDLAEMYDSGNADNAQTQWQEDAVTYRDVLELMLRFPKPLIAALNGPTLAAGAGLALACDMVIAAPEATFGFPEPKLGLVAGVAAPLLTFRVGAGHAAHLLLTAAIVEAHEAHRIGIVHELVANDKLWARGVEIARQLSASAPESLLLTKRMLNETIGEQLEMLFSAGSALSATARTTEAAAEGLSAFVEKRAPKWP